MRSDNSGRSSQVVVVVNSISPFGLKTVVNRATVASLSIPNRRPNGEIRS